MKDENAAEANRAWLHEFDKLKARIRTLEEVIIAEYYPKTHAALVTALQQRITELEKWRDDAIKWSLNAQEIGRALDLPLATQVTTEIVLKCIQELRDKEPPQK